MDSTERSILNDPTLSDKAKADRLGITEDQVREKLANLEHLKSDPVATETGYKTSENLAKPGNVLVGDERATPSAGKINPDAVRVIVNDSSLTDAAKAERLGISQASYEAHQAALSSDPATVEQDLLNAQEAHRASLEVDLSKGAHDPLRPTFEAGGDGRRQHAALMEYEASKVTAETGKTTDGRRAFSPAEQQAYNNYGGDVPVKHIWDFFDKIEAGAIKAYDGWTGRTKEDVRNDQVNPRAGQPNL